MRSFVRNKYAWGAIALIGGIVLWVVQRGNEPVHSFDRFADATRRRDVQSMLNQVDKSELDRLGVSPSQYEAMLQKAAGSTGAIKIGRATEVALNRRQRNYNRVFQVDLQDASGRPLLGKDSAPLRPFVCVYKTDNGWKIGASLFLYTITTARNGMVPDRKLRYAELCSEFGADPEIYWPYDATWERIPVSGQSQGQL